MYMSVFFCDHFPFFHILSSSHAVFVSLSCSILAVPMPKCCRQYSCLSSTFSLAILNGTFSLCCGKFLMYSVVQLSEPDLLLYVQCSYSYEKHAALFSLLRQTTASEGSHWCYWVSFVTCAVNVPVTSFMCHLCGHCTSDQFRVTCMVTGTSNRCRVSLVWSLAPVIGVVCHLCGHWHQ